jgi:uncharacterized membrane protein YccC
VNGSVTGRPGITPSGGGGIPRTGTNLCGAMHDRFDQPTADIATHEIRRQATVKGARDHRGVGRAGLAAIRSKLGSWRDIVVASDPGQSRLRAAIQMALSFVVALPVAYGFIQLAHPDWISAASAVHVSPSLLAKLHAQHHGASSLVQARDPEDSERQARRLDRGLVRLNETSLLADAELADPRSRLEPDVAQALHERLFDLEIVLQNIASSAAALAGRRLHDPVRAQVAAWLSELRAGRAPAAGRWLERDDHAPAGPGQDQFRDGLLRQLAELCVNWERQINSSRSPAVTSTPAGQRLDDMYASPIVLIGGNLAGSSPASAAAVASGSNRLATLLHLDSAAQAAIRVTVAVGAAAAVGSAISEQRYYWAVIAVFVVYAGTNTVSEQVLKVAHRVAGTVIGILLGSLLAQAVGPTAWSLAVIIPAVALNAYFVQVNYALSIVALTIVVSQLYVQLGEYSHHLLLARLEITTVGAVIGAAVAVLVFPVATRSALIQAGDAYLTALKNLLERVRDAVAGRAPVQTLTVESRKLDDTLAQLLTTARPLTRAPFRSDQMESNMALWERAAHYARNLVAATRAVPARAGCPAAAHSSARRRAPEGQLARRNHQRAGRERQPARDDPGSGVCTRSRPRQPRRRPGPTHPAVACALPA